MGDLLCTALYDRHRALGAQLVAFGGWEMPLQYPGGIVREHLACRKVAALFDVSHMGSLAVRGADAQAFLQHVLTNNAAGPDVEQAQYTLIPTQTGGAVDDAYLCRFVEDEYLLVVNAANREKDLVHLAAHVSHFGDVTIADRTRETAMLALQGPRSREILESVIEDGRLPDPLRNELGQVRIGRARVGVSRTGYTGEPLGFELFCDAARGPDLWDRLAAAGATPAGLGARDTLRLEAGMPLYGRELGCDPEGREIPCFAIPPAKTAVSFSPLKGAYVGRATLLRQREAFEGIVARDYARRADLPRLIQPVALLGAGVARAGDRVLRQGRVVGWVTSGTRVPYWVFDGDGLDALPTDRHGLRSLCLAYLDCDLVWDDRVQVEVRGRPVEAVVVQYHLRSEAPPFARPILQGHEPTPPQLPAGPEPKLVLSLLGKTAQNTRWRQRECVNLIPSEMTLSPMARLVSVMDPAFRYAEHRQVEAFYETDVFYYQGVDFIREVERLLVREFRRYLGCREAEVRPVSGQMANAVVFGALVDYANRADPKREPQRLRQAVNHHIIRGGHLSAQPMGALRDFVARDPPHRPARGGGVPGAPRQSLPNRRARGPQGHRPLPAPAHRLRQEHGAPPRARGRGARVRGRAQARRRDPLRHGPRAGPGGAPFSRTLRRRRPPGDGLDPQNLLWHPARRDRLRLGGARGALRALGGGAAADLPRLGLEPPPGHALGVPGGRLRDEPLQGLVPARRARQRQGLRPGSGPGRTRRGRRPGPGLHPDSPGGGEGGLRQGTRGGPAPGAEQHRLQLPGAPRRGGFHRRRGPSPGGGRDDPVRHGARGLRDPRRTHGRRPVARQECGRRGRVPAPGVPGTRVLLPGEEFEAALEELRGML